MSSFEQKELLPRKCVVEIREVHTTKEEPYLFLLISEENSIRVISTNEVEFYGEYKNAEEKVKVGEWTCDSKTRELLEVGIEEIYNQFNYPDDIYSEGRSDYIYNNILEQMHRAEQLQAKSLYSWKDNWGENLKCLGCSFYTNPTDKLFVKVEKKKRKTEVITWKRLNKQYQKYYILNAYFSTVLGGYGGEDQKMILGHLNTDKDDVPDFDFPYVLKVDEETVGVLIDSFKFDIMMFTRQLVLPYDDFTKRLEEYSGMDEFEMLDLLCMEYVYPRTEIKKRIAECILIKKMKEKKASLGDEAEQKKKGFLKRLIGF